ncbi:MAG: hypothetical protein GEU75_12680 [Dehalococcoidia bacterium]|nr:hypothetical protein [Dehalococcoidia bacterium]
MVDDKPGNLRSQIRLAGTLAALAVLILFIALNFGDVEIELFIANLDTQLGFALIFAALLGFLVGYFVPKK